MYHFCGAAEAAGERIPAARVHEAGNGALRPRGASPRVLADPAASGGVAMSDSSQSAERPEEPPAETEPPQDAPGEPDANNSGAASDAGGAELN